jgi:mRNA interferase HigB
MRIIARRTLREFVDSLAGHRDQSAVKAALDPWFAEVKRARWRNTADVKRLYATASIVTAERIGFNVKGNAYRLVVAVGAVGADGLGWAMQSRIKCKWLLQSDRIRSSRVTAHEDEIPTEDRYRAWGNYELVPSQQIIPKLLLTSAGKAGPQPVGIGNHCRLDNIYTSGVSYVYRSQCMGNSV